MNDRPILASDIPFDDLSGVALDDPSQVIATLCERAGVFRLTAASSGDDFHHAITTLRDLLAASKLDDPHREAARVAVHDHCRADGIKGKHRLIDVILKPTRPPSSTSRGPGTVPAITLADDDPCPGPVDRVAVLNDTAALIRRHIVLTVAQADAVTLWIAAAHLIGVLSVMPILLISAPTMRAGKTTLLMLLSALVPRALVASNITGAVLVRLIAKYQPTMLLDEADTWLRRGTDDADMRGVINAGEYRQTAVVYRCAPETHEPQAIPCFAARVLAMIGQPAPTIADRSILIALRRKSHDERVDRMRLDTLRDDHRILRQQWRRVADDIRSTIQDTAATLPDELIPPAVHSDRARGHWRPLLAIADQVGCDWPARARIAASALSGDVDTAESTVELLRDIRDVFADADDPDALASGKLLDGLIALDDRPWKEWTHGRPLSGAKLAHLLKGYDIHPAGTIRVGDKVCRAYRRVAFVEAWDRYLAIDDDRAGEHVETLQRNKPNDSGAESPISKCYNADVCNTSQSVTNPTDTERCYAVTLPQGGNGRDGRF